MTVAAVLGEYAAATQRLELALSIYENAHVHSPIFDSLINSATLERLQVSFEDLWCQLGLLLKIRSLRLRIHGKCNPDTDESWLRHASVTSKIFLLRKNRGEQKAKDDEGSPPGLPIPPWMSFSRMDMATPLEMQGVSDAEKGRMRYVDTLLYFILSHILHR